jgi:CubicO group peptidase (beta-lactamase class C family)
MEVCAALPPSEQEQLPVDRAALEALIERIMGPDRGDAPGAVVMVLHDGQVIAQRQSGMASLEHGVPFTPNHVVRLPYSEGREFIAITAALMEQDGLIRLDEPVRNYFPQLPAWSAPVRLRDLVHHRSGFVDEWSVLLLMHGSMANRLDESQFLRLLYEQPAPEVEPVTGYMYSNSDYGLLRLVLEQAAEGDLARYMKRRLFDPLRMHSTRLADDAAVVIPQLAPAYAPDGDGYRHSTEVKTSPGGRYVIATTACDLARWADAHANSASDVSRAVARLMDDARPVPGLSGHYAFGHTVADVDGMRVMRHEGVLECNYLTRVPELGYAIITFGNGYYDPDENRAVVRYLLNPADDEPGGEVASPPVTITAAELDRYAGRYVSMNIPSWDSHTLARQLVDVAVSGDRLTVRFPWDRLALVPLGAGTFSWHTDISAMRVEFDATQADGPARMVVSFSDGAPSETYERLVGWVPSLERLQHVAGRYHSPHLDYPWTLMIDEAGGLVLRAPTMADTKVEPYQENEFLLRHEKFPGMPARYWIRFHENEVGEITHLTVWNPRLMHHRFDRAD